MIEFKAMEPKYIDEAITLALYEYEEECKRCNQLLQEDFKKELEDLIRGLVTCTYGKVAIENDKLIGYLAFWGPWDGFNGNVKGVFSPLGGSAFAGKDRNKLASMLLEAVTSDMAKDAVFSIALSRYAHDEEVAKSFIMNSFGIRCTDAILKLDDYKESVDKMEFQYEEVEPSRKKEMKHLRDELIYHIAQAPIFFPSDLASQEKWIEDDDIRVFIAKDNERIIGFMSICTEGEAFVTNSSSMYSICGAFVDKDYRSTGVAKGLLDYIVKISREDGKAYLGVDCETMNPNALRFWSKYFSSYTYSYHRRIDERIFEYDKYYTRYHNNQ